MQLADQRRSPADPWRRNRPVVSLELVRGWLDRAFTLHGESWSAVSLATGVAERTLYRVRLNDQQGVAVDVAEAVASSIGAMEEFREAVQPGVEGWGPDSRYCQRCGRYDLPHHAKNLCRRCYQTTWYWTNVMKRPTPPPIAERWSRSHEKCVECGTTELRHQALGRCNPCYRRLQKRRNRNG